MAKLPRVGICPAMITDLQAKAAVSHISVGTMHEGHLELAASIGMNLNSLKFTGSRHDSAP